eukprot:gnl/TRDRNA2_/TRDRNA2_158960_c1_seq1.p1 gnl/TRDRNA2_/TRDRNA2_158960_c1~~gnl/TRDRNA2_/TRDRNA2_158960_c1_seq1.p1  ORF type:complete len:337 (+),score=63.61 gnl/TRDRNA2_/TRDRNA2_158960_c1_seq1:2-1012(+)
MSGTDIASQDRVYRSLRRRLQRAGQTVEESRAQAVQAREELDRWNRKRDTYEEMSGASEALKPQHAAIQAECARLREELDPSKKEWHNLRSRTAACEETSQQKAEKLATLRANCQEAITAMKAGHVEELAKTRSDQAEELAQLEASWASQVSALRTQNAEEAARLRCSMEEAERRRESLRRERDEAADQLLARQREGSRLQQQYADARQEAADMAAEVRNFQVMPRQLGASILDSSMDSNSFQVEDPRIEAELHSLRRHCAALQRECAKAHGALEQKQAECERWRRRSFDSASPTRLMPDSPSMAPGASRSLFTLGPQEGEVAAGLALPSPTRGSY